MQLVDDVPAVLGGDGDRRPAHLKVGGEGLAGVRREGGGVAAGDGSKEEERADGQGVSEPDAAASARS